MPIPDLLLQYTSMYSYIWIQKLQELPFRHSRASVASNRHRRICDIRRLSSTAHTMYTLPP